MNVLHQLVSIDRTSKIPVYLQVCDQLIEHICAGRIAAGSRLPGSRIIASQLELHRNTVVKALEELEAQGWIEIRPQQGAYVLEDLPVLRAQQQTQPARSSTAPLAGFELYDHPHLEDPYFVAEQLAFDDGAPDPRLAPIRELGTAYATALRKLVKRNGLNYSGALGYIRLREALTTELRSTRGINVEVDQIMITRGVIMALRLASELMLRAGDGVVVGATNYGTANMCFRHAGAQLHKVPVDAKGLVIDAIPALCRRHRIRMIYVTPHHHHPTTVTMTAERRMQLLQMASRYNFVILEDDYDYEFHYANRPILPLASMDAEGRVLYCGSFTKAIAPAFRVGYLVAAPAIIARMPKVRRLLDRQGDTMLEAAIAELLMDGTIRRYLKKALKTYRGRRDYFCEQLHQRFAGQIQFEKPAGGMAIWARFDPGIDLVRLSPKLKQQGVFLSNGLHYNPDNQQLNATRMGFARMNQGEMKQALEVLERTLISRK
ncbi:MAG: PLP-dependent aminotransferase family protein [Bacteroidota bacterium]